MNNIELAEYFQLLGYKDLFEDQGVDVTNLFLGFNYLPINSKRLEEVAEIEEFYCTDSGWVEKSVLINRMEQFIERKGYSEVRLIREKDGFQFVARDMTCTDFYEDYFYFDTKGVFINKKELSMEESRTHIYFNL